MKIIYSIGPGANAMNTFKPFDCRLQKTWLNLTNKSAALFWSYLLMTSAPGKWRYILDVDKDTKMFELGECVKITCQSSKINNQLRRHLQMSRQSILKSIQNFQTNSCYGLVGRAVASNTRGPRFESSN